jgi:hypothetical protein
VQPGVYRLTASIKGFDTAVYTDIVVNAARTTNQPVNPKVGTVVRPWRSPALLPPCSCPTPPSRIRWSRNICRTCFCPDAKPPFALTNGAQQGVTARDSTFEGMPGASINITLDGISNNAQRFKSGGTSFNFVAKP